MANSTDSSTTPPWGDDFDAETAWKLVQNLRGDKTELQTKLSAATSRAETAESEVETLKTAAESAAEQGKTEAQKLAERIAALEQSNAKSTRDLMVERAKAKHSIPDDLAEFLTGETEEAIEAVAERLAKYAAAGGNSGEPGDDANGGEGETPAAPLPTKPKPALTPGNGDDTTTSFDPAAVASAARASH